jgi:hypothetical protein
MRKFTLCVLLGLVSFGLSAARLTLRDGTVIYGQFISGSADNIVFQEDRGEQRRFDMNQVQSIDFSTASPDPANPNSPNGHDPQEGHSQADRYDGPRRYGPSFAVLQPGSEISVRTDQTIYSRNAVEGQSFPASIHREIVDPKGNVLVPRGSPAGLAVRRVDEGGTFNNGDLILDLDWVQVNGKRYWLHTSDAKAPDSQGLGANRRTGELVGGGAVLGTLLGAIAGGGKGAAIGALAGGAAGGGVEVLTKGREIRVPAESILNFRLDQPLELREAQ